MLGPAKKLKWYRAIILSMLASGTATAAVSFPGLILNSNESSRIYLSASVSTLLIAVLEEDSLLCDKYRYRFLKYEIHKYPTYISLILTGK